nr:acyl-CoA dehydrogenase family protein [Pseudonocardia sp. AL041005-10]
MASDDLLEPPVPVLTAPYHTPEREALQKQAREFAATRVLPVADELDPRKGEIPRDLLDEMGELGYFGITVDRAHGGLGLGAFEYCMVAEELARAWMSVGSIIARAQGAGTAVTDPERRAELLRRSARGRWIGAIALSEPDAGSDLAGVETRAVRDGDEFVITGHKRWTGNAKAADFIQVLVRTDDPAPGRSAPRAWRRSSWRRSATPSPPGSPAARSTRSATTASSPGTWSSTACGCRSATSSAPAARASPTPSRG